MRTEIRVGTRGSLLATTQTRTVCEMLQKQYPALRIVEVQIPSHGDGGTEPLRASKTPGVFVSTLRAWLLTHRVDCIVHSMKDLPAQPHPGIVTACVPPRADARDALVSRSGLPLHELPPGSRVGTSSPRRAASIRAQRSDLSVVNIRGNIDSRIQKVLDGDYDATILALAGVQRIGRADEMTQIFSTQDMVPAPGQGALSVECRAGDRELLAMLQHLNDPLAALLTTAERAVLRELRAGCATAIGASASYHDGLLTVIAELSHEHTGATVHATASATLASADLRGAAAVGVNVARQLLDSDLAATVADTFHSSYAMQPAGAVLLVRGNRNQADAEALAARNIPTITDPHLTIVPSPDVLAARRLVRALCADRQTWFVVTSANALTAFEQLLEPGTLPRIFAQHPQLRCAAIGDHTRNELLAQGAPRVYTPEHPSLDSLVTMLRGSAPATLVIPSGSRALTEHDAGLQREGFTLLREVVYTTERAADVSTSIDALRQQLVRAVLFRSPSAVQAFASFHGAPEIPVICAGPRTATCARELGFTVTGVAPHPNPDAVAHTIATTLKGIPS